MTEVNVKLTCSIEDVPCPFCGHLQQGLVFLIRNQPQMCEKCGEAFSMEVLFSMPIIQPMKEMEG